MLMPKLSSHTRITNAVVCIEGGSGLACFDGTIIRQTYGSVKRVAHSRPGGFHVEARRTFAPA